MNLDIRVQDLITEIEAVKTTSNARDVVKKFNNFLNDVGASIVLSHSESHIIFNILPITDKGLPDILSPKGGSVSCGLTLVHVLLEYIQIQLQEIKKDADKREESNTEKDAED